MTRLLQNDLEAEAITLEADARRIRAAFDEADMAEANRADAIRLYVEPRREAAAKLRAAKSALQSVLPVGIRGLRDA